MVVNCGACYLTLDRALSIRFIVEGTVRVNNMSTRKRINRLSTILIAVLDVARQGPNRIDSYWADGRIW
jgi:hypothetical protein